MSYEKIIGVRPTVLTNDKYRLELVWESVKYEKDGICKLIGAKFKGPAMKHAEKLEPNDHISLDFYRQYFVKVKNVYIATLNWGAVTYNADGSVSLETCTLSHDTELNNEAPNIGDKDLIIIDTKGHERETHMFYFTYPAYVASPDKSIYNFIEG